MKDKILKKNSTIIILFVALFLVGEIFGTYIFFGLDSGKNITFFSFVTDFFSYNGHTQNIFERILSSFSNGFIYLFSAFLLGFCMIFEPLVFAVPIVRGLEIGIVLSGMLSSAENFSDYLSIAFFIIFGILSSMIIFIGSREAFYLSSGIFTAVFYGKSLEINVRLYINKFLILTFLLAIMSVVDGILSGILSYFLF